MIMTILKVIVVAFAVVGGVNVYNSSSFQEMKTSVMKNNTTTITVITDVVKDVTRTDSAKHK